MNEIQNYKEVLEILNDPNFWIPGQATNNFDPEAHSASRQVLVKLLQENQIFIKEKIVTVAQQILRELKSCNSFDLQTQFSFVFAKELAFQLLGIEEEKDKMLLLEAAWDIFYMNDSEEKEERGAEASRRLSAYFIEALRLKKEGCLLAAFAQNADAGMSSLGHIVQLFVGICSSLPLLLGNAIAALLQYPEQQQIYMDNPDAAVNELLRYAGPAQIIYRKVSESAAGTYEKGSLLALNLYKANRDATVFEAAESLLLSCPRAAQLSLGKGRHSCLGAGLIRAVLGIVPKFFFDNFSNIKADFSTLETSGSKAIQGIYKLKITL